MYRIVRVFALLSLIGIVIYARPLREARVMYVQSNSETAAMRTFTSQDGSFRFKYSSVLVHCTPERREEGYPGFWVPPDACQSMGGVCEAAGSRANTIACFAYPKDKFKEKPEFVAAAFFVAEVKQVTTAKACLEGSQYWNINTTKNGDINGINFKIFHISDAGLGSSQGGDIYRAFHNSKCYELGVQMANSNPAAFDPETIKEFTKRDRDEVYGRLNQALDSFKFLK